MACEYMKVHYIIPLGPVVECLEYVTNITPRCFDVSITNRPSCTKHLINIRTELLNRDSGPLYGHVQMENNTTC